MNRQEAFKTHSIKRGKKWINFSLGTSLEITSNLVFANEERSCVVLEYRGPITFSSKYFNRVQNLDPNLRTQHIEATAQHLRYATEIIFQKPQKNPA